MATLAGGETPKLRDVDDVLEYERVVEAVGTDENVAFDDTVCVGVRTSEGESSKTDDVAWAEGLQVIEPTCEAEIVVVLIIELVRRLVAVDVSVLLLSEDIDGKDELVLAAERVIESIKVLEVVSEGELLADSEEVTEDVSDGELLAESEEVTENVCVRRDDAESVEVIDEVSVGREVTESVGVIEDVSVTRDDVETVEVCESVAVEKVVGVAARTSVGEMDEDSHIDTV